MEKITAFSQKRKSGTYFELLSEGAALSWEILRLKAEAERVYQEGSKIGLEVLGIHERTDLYITGTSTEFKRLITLDEDVSIVGELSLNEMKKRRDRLNERIAIREARGNIVPLRRPQ